MTGKQAIKEISKYAPCPHDNSDTSLGNGKIWARCEDCLLEFKQENWQEHRDAAEKFEDAIDKLRKLIR